MKSSKILTFALMLSSLCVAMCGGDEGQDGDGSEVGNDSGVPPEDVIFGGGTALYADGGVIGDLRPDGTVVDSAGNVVGVVQEDGSVVDLEGNVIGTVEGVGLETVKFGECAATIVAGENIPVDIFVMFDQSGSMVQEDDLGTMRIDAVRSAIGDFLTDPASLGLGVGIGYFGKQPIGEVSCDPADYSLPDVAIARIPGNTEAITSSLAAVEPTGETPTGAAIRGACEYASTWRTENPTHVAVILLVTDGVPEAPVSSSMGGCDPTLEDAVGAAATCFSGDPSIQTYVIGVGPSLQNLNQIAEAGATNSAYLVEGGDVASEMLQALNDVRGTAQIPCEFTIPEPPDDETLDYGKVNAVYTTPEGETQQLLYVESMAGCDPETGGWYYDDAGAPSRILLCESTCTDVEQPGGRFSVALGCETVTDIR